MKPLFDKFWVVRAISFYNSPAPYKTEREIVCCGILCSCLLRLSRLESFNDLPAGVLKSLAFIVILYITVAFETLRVSIIMYRD